MKVGEIIFYYKTGRTIKEFYFSEAERNGFIQTYKDAIYRKIIPYTGEGLPNYLHLDKKEYAAVITRYGSKIKGWIARHELNQHLHAA